MKKDNKNQELNQNEKNSYLKNFFIILFALTLFCAGMIIIFYTINTKCDISVNDCKNIILNKVNFLDKKLLRQKNLFRIINWVKILKRSRILTMHSDFIKKRKQYILKITLLP